MGELRFTLTFFGGKAEEHRVSADKLGSILRSLGDDIQNVCHVISSEDVNVDIREVLRECKLYVVGTPLESSLEIPIASEETKTKWPELAAKTYISSLRELPESNGLLPKGLTRSILENVVAYSHDSEYDGLHLTMAPNGEPESRVTFDFKMAVTARRKLAELPTFGPAIIYGHSVTGIMYGLEDQDYADPHSSVTVEVDAGEGKKWMCHIPKDRIPSDIANHWKERVVVRGVANLRKRKPEMDVEDIKLLGPETDIDEVLDRFIRTNQALWQGEDTLAYMNRVRERD